MPYYKDHNQKGVPAGKTKYYFDASYNGQRFRERVVCRSIEAPRKFAEWVEMCQAGSSGGDNLLFELFERYLQEFVRVHKSNKQYKTEVVFFANRLKKFFQNEYLIEIKRCHIERYLAWRAEQEGRNGKVSRSTLNKDLNILSSFFSWCIRHEYYNKVSPCTQLRKNEQNFRHVRLNGAQIVELLKKSVQFGGLHTVVMLGVFTGLRKREMMRLKWDDIDFETRHIEIRAENSKSKKMRSIPMPDLLFDYLIKLEHTSEKVITISDSTLKRHFKEFRETLSFKDNLTVDRLTVHDLRHIYAGLMRDSGVSLDDVQHFLGHSSPVVTHMRYAQAGGFDGVSKVNRIVNIIEPKVN
ncbi:MAG: site-specific integrase [Spirochaetes bacterium]|nr:site-specific integrase [Spirochaetota bacterium]